MFGIRNPFVFKLTPDEILKANLPPVGYCTTCGSPMEWIGYKENTSFDSETGLKHISYKTITKTCSKHGILHTQHNMANFGSSWELV